MKRYWTYGLTLLMCLIWSAAEAQLSLYDDFGSGYINPEKWIAPPMCGSGAYDCAREVQNKKLRLAVRGYGATATDSGVAFDASPLLFPNPNTIETIGIQFKVKSFRSVGCPSNNEAAHPQLLVHGAFFNTGSGNPNDDVMAFLMVERRTDDVSSPPKSLRVGGFMWTNGSFFNNVDLGTVKINETATATLTWDRTNHAFIARVVKKVTTPLVVEATMPYPQPDSTPAAQPFKSLRLGSFAPNCTTGQSFSAMDVNIDNVQLNASAVQ